MGFVGQKEIADLLVLVELKKVAEQQESLVRGAVG